MVLKFCSSVKREILRCITSAFSLAAFLLVVCIISMVLFLMRLSGVLKSGMFWCVCMIFFFLLLFLFSFLFSKSSIRASSALSFSTRLFNLLFGLLMLFVFCVSFGLMCFFKVYLCGFCFRFLFVVTIT